MDLLNKCRDEIKSVVGSIARLLDYISAGKVTPNHITYTGLIMHLPIAWLIGMGHLLLAATLLVIFGLFDTLDGELARLQKSTSALGMFIDSSTDRIKEIFLYCGISALLFTTGNKYLVVATVGALGASLCTSYLNAWGEVVLSTTQNKGAHNINKSFRSGLLGFDLRMLLIIIGLLANQLEAIIYTILVLATLTAVQRYIHITRKLQTVNSLHVQD